MRLIRASYQDVKEVNTYVYFSHFDYNKNPRPIIEGTFIKFLPSAKFVGERDLVLEVLDEHGPVHARFALHRNTVEHYIKYNFPSLKEGDKVRLEFCQLESLKDYLCDGYSLHIDIVVNEKKTSVYNDPVAVQLLIDVYGD